MLTVASLEDDPRVIGESGSEGAHEQQYRAETFVLEMQIVGNRLFERRAM